MLLWTRRALATGLLVSLFALGACSTGPDPLMTPALEPETQGAALEVWDDDGDGVLDIDEFEGHAGTNFYAWDADRDGVLDDDELGAKLDPATGIAAWDADRDGVLDEDEFEAGMFDTWDADDSETIDDDEFGGDFTM